MSYMYVTPDLSLYSFGLSDPTILESMAFNSDRTIFLSMPKKKTNSSSRPPKHRHDGTSPLPLGMDWSPPPRTWDGRNSVWPHDPHTGWSYCVIIPSWIILPSSRGSDPVVFYRVQVGIQSPEGITTIHGILRRFNDFLKLFSDLKNEFPNKTLPPAPPRRLLRMKNRSLLEERRCALEDWMEKLLSDIDLSRTVHVAIFLELEAAVRSSFYDSNQIALDENLPANSVVPSYHLPTNSDASLAAVSSSFASDLGSDYAYETSELETPSCGRENGFKVSIENSTSNQDLPGDNSLKFAEAAEASKSLDLLVGSGLHIPSDFLVNLPPEEQQKVNSVFIDMQLRLATANTNMEDLLARLNQELSVKQYLTTKVKDLEVELETTKQSEKENFQQGILNERDKFTQMQSDTEDFRRKCTELELKLKSEQDEKMLIESTTISITQQNKMLRQELDVTLEKFENLQKHQEELELKSKSNV